MKEKMLKLVPYILAFGVMFYVTPLLVKDTGSGMLILLFVLPIFSFAVGVNYGMRYGFDVWVAVVSAVLFLPSVFIFYNSGALIYALVYAVCTAIGDCLGYWLFYRKKKN